MSEADPTDEQLARECRAGSRPAFDQLVRRHHGRVFAFLMTLTRHRHDAEDLTQDTFLRAWRKIDRFDPERPLLPWLLTIARRLSIARLRKRRPDPEPEPLVTEARTPSLDLWRFAERSLSRPAFSALWLHYHDGFTLAEVGEVLGKREGAVKVMLHRARRSLAARLAEGGGPPPPLPRSCPPPLPSIWNTRTAP